MNRFLLIAFIFLSTSNAHSSPQVVKLTTSDQFASLNLAESPSLPKSGLKREMALAKKAFYEGNKAQCLRWSRSVGRKSSSIAHWAHVLELKCALLEPLNLSELSGVLGRIKKHPHWLLSSHFVKEIRHPYMDGLVQQAKLYGRSHRTKAWEAIDEAFSHKDWMSSQQEAELYALAGEISFVDQNLLAAKDYFMKSLALRDSAQLRDRVGSILLALSSKKEPRLDQSELDFIKRSTASKEEERLFQRMNAALDSKDLLSALDDGVGLLNQFPRGTFANEVESKISSLFIGMATGPEDSWDQIQSRVLRTMKKAGGDRLLVWAKLGFARGQYRESFELAEKAADKLGGQEVAGDAYSLAAQAAQSSGEFHLAAKNFKTVVDQYSGAPFFYESLFRLGLVYMRKGNFSEAVASFEKLLSSQGGEDFEYRAIYWAWRSLQKLNLERAKNLQELLIQKYPMTLYGMRALAERSDGFIKLSNQKKVGVVKVSLRLLPDQKASWDRFRLLLSGGWLDEACAELKNLPQPQGADEYLVYSKLFSSARDYVTAIQMMNKAWELNPEYAYRKQYLTWIFPDSYQSEIRKWSEKRQLQPVWVKSLIRQESAFNPRAVSRSRAMGLMQLLPSTAQEVATDLGKSSFQVPDSLFDSALNVELGTTYLKRMFSRYESQLPFALAAYNAGPTRLSRWLKASGVELKEDELWVDEMPWSETSYYVKAILRNILIFQILDQGQLKINSPIWQISESSS